MFNIWGEIGRKLKLCHSLAPPGILDPSDPSVRNAESVKATVSFFLPQVRLHVKKETKDASTVPALTHVVAALCVTQTAA